MLYYFFKAFQELKIRANKLIFRKITWSCFRFLLSLSCIFPWFLFFPWSWFVFYVSDHHILIVLSSILIVLLQLFFELDTLVLLLLLFSFHFLLKPWFIRQFTQFFPNSLSFPSHLIWVSFLCLLALHSFYWLRSKAHCMPNNIIIND